MMQLGWRHGIGTVLESAARASLVEFGNRLAELWVLAGNVRAMDFHWSRGWVSEGSSRRAHVWGIAVTELRFTHRLEASASGAVAEQVHLIMYTKFAEDPVLAGQFTGAAIPHLVLDGARNSRSSGSCDPMRKSLAITRRLRY
jgi:hypothetical protein